MKKHYVAMAGLTGCLPSMVMADTNKADLIDAIVGEHTDLENGFTLPRVKQELKDTWYAVLDLKKFGNEYIQIDVCTCGDISNHFDD